MDGNFPPPVPPFVGFHPTGYAPMLTPEAFPSNLHQIPALSMESLGGYPEFESPDRAILPAQGSQRRRRPAGAEHVKHRRTRSGCYTCRQRRVKCDEARPTCERCRKGKRDCNYPGTPSSASKDTKADQHAADSAGPSSPSGSEGGKDDGASLSPILDDEDHDGEADNEEPQSATSYNRQRSESFPASVDASSSPSIASTVSFSRETPRPQPGRTTSKSSVRSGASQNSRWASLSQEVKFYLRFFKDSITYHHYSFKCDGNDFLHKTLLEMALADTSSALLYAIVAFSAYHHTILRTDDNISIFLAYYDRSIRALRQSLTVKKSSMATLFTILQLAAIEEYLGDWVNLLGHQRAAHDILTALLTPQNCMQDEMRRKAVQWYFRFDIFAGLMSGTDTMLDRSWTAACHEYFAEQHAQRPYDLNARWEAYFSRIRLLGADVTRLFAAGKTSTISGQSFELGYQTLESDFAIARQEFEGAFAVPSNYVKTFPRAPPPSDSDISDYRDPNFLYAGELTTLNFVLIDFWAIDLTFKYQVHQAQTKALMEECQELAVKICKMFEAIEYGDEGPAGGVMGAQASLGMAALCLPNDDKHIMWVRQKFALVEQLGHIYPAALRTRMSEHLGVDLTHWWLPEEGSYPRIIRALRDFVLNRATLPRDTTSEDVNTMNGFFRSLNIE